MDNRLRHPPPTNIKMDHKKIERMIIEVSACPALYDSKSSGYKDKMYRDDCWERISRNLDVDLDECKKRWKTVRDSFTSIIRKGQSHVTLWPYFEIMQFYLPYTRFYASQGTSRPTKSLDNTITEQDDGDLKSEVYIEPISYTNDYEYNETDGDDTGIPAKRARYDQDEPVETTEFTSKTPIHKFFASLAGQVQHFSNPQKIRLQLKCLAAVYEIETEGKHSE